MNRKLVIGIVAFIMIVVVWLFLSGAAVAEDRVEGVSIVEEPTLESEVVVFETTRGDVEKKPAAKCDDKYEPPEQPEWFEPYEKCFNRLRKHCSSTAGEEKDRTKKIRKFFEDFKSTNEQDWIEKNWGNTIYGKPRDRDDVSVSGIGSRCVFSCSQRCYLHSIVKDFEIDLVMDLVMGDLNWMRHFIHSHREVYYLGSDASEGMVSFMQQEGHGSNAEFVYGGNVAGDNFWSKIKKAEVYKKSKKKKLAFVRHALQHNSPDTVNKILAGLKDSGADYFMATNRPFITNNKPIKDGGYSEYNLFISPFNVKPPEACWFERPSKEHIRKIYFCLWKLPM